MAAHPQLRPASASAATAAATPAVPSAGSSPPPAPAPAATLASRCLDPQPWPASASVATTAATPAVPRAGSPPPCAPAPASALAVAALASRRSDPAIQGRRVTRTLLGKEETTSSTSTEPSAPATAGAASVLPTSSPSALVTNSSPTAPVSGASPAAAHLHLEVASPLLQCAPRPSDMTTVGLSMGRPVSWASIADEDVDDEEDEELAPLTPPAAKSSVPAAHPTEQCVMHAKEGCGGWQEVLPRHGRRRPVSPTPALTPRPIPAWLFGRCCRCLVPGHRAADCRDPLRCSRCLENGHWARGCRNAWRPFSSLACLAMSPRSRLGIEHCRAPAPCEGPMESQLPSKVLHRRSWASVVSGHVESATPSDILLQSTLAAQAELLVRVGCFLERAEAALGKLSLVPTVSQSTPTQGPPSEVDVGGSVKNKVAELYGCFSPRAVDNSSSSAAFPDVLSTIDGGTIPVVVPPVLQVMPQLQVLCAGSASPLSVEHTTVDTHATTCEGHDSTVTRDLREVNSPGHSHVASASIPPPLTDKSNALFTKELCDLLASVEVVSPGTGRAIACLLTGTTFKGKGKKASDCPQTGTVEKSLRCKSKKSGAIGKAPAAA